MESETLHIPVMLTEVLEALRADAGGDFLDCTLGGGGHTEGLLAANPTNFVVAIDRDQRAIDRARRRLSGESKRIELIQAAFSDLRDMCSGKQFDGILADLGLSTDQLSEERGFSFNDDSPLDMRMDESQPVTADSIVNGSTERELFAILKRGGVGREARAVAKAIVDNRPVRTTRELARVICKAAQPYTGKKKINPATVPFQAIRIAVNGEFEEIETLLKAAPALMKKGGRLAVITFHSLEDKAVAHTMRAWEADSTAPAWWPRSKLAKRGIEQPLGRMVSKKAIQPSEDEIKRNPASRSARLRVFEFVS